MFLHVFKYRLKIILKDRAMVFWTLLFPVVLVTLFNFAFAGLRDNHTFKSISVAVVEVLDSPVNNGLIDTMLSLKSQDEALFDTVLVDETKGLDLLMQGEVKGLIRLDESVTLQVAENGFEASIIKMFLDEFVQTNFLVENIVKDSPEKLNQAMTKIRRRVNYVNKGGLGASNVDETVVYFYALMAMACMYGGFYGMKEVDGVQANISKLAARMNLSPVHKLKTFLIGISAAMVIQVAGIFLLLSYMVFVLKIDFGQETGMIVLITLLGSLLGVSFGAFVSSATKASENVKVGILLVVSMVGSLLSGMMVLEIKYLVSANAPILMYINPVNLISDAYYTLYYYGVSQRLVFNIIGIAAYSVVFWLFTYFFIRRRKYASL